MECEHRVFPDQALSIIRLRGDVTSDSVLERLSNLIVDACWNPSFSMLWDARDIQRLTIAPSDIDLLLDSSQFKGQRSPARVAVVVARQIEYQILSLILVHRDATPRIPKVFCDLPAALGWLGITDPPEMLR